MLVDRCDYLGNVLGAIGPHPEHVHQAAASRRLFQVVPAEQQEVGRRLALHLTDDVQNHVELVTAAAELNMSGAKRLCASLHL